jgi:tRNA pseudouridine38-40 synthase
MPQRYRMTVAYDGTDYAGWQIQPNGVTVQEKLQAALAQIVGESCKVHGSGRTDCGVHARRQVAHTDLAKPICARSVLRGLNAVLPPDIRVGVLTRAPADFHARRSATGKEYRYRIWDGAVLSPFLLRYRCHAKTRLNTEAMRTAAAGLTGRHDFSAFSANPHREQASAVRTLFALTVTRQGSDVTVQAYGEGFLYKMVRSLAGFLMRVGEGALPPDATGEILASRQRTARVPTAPPQGLFLWNVFYARDQKGFAP